MASESESGASVNKKSESEQTGDLDLLSLERRSLTARSATIATLSAGDRLLVREIAKYSMCNGDAELSTASYGDQTNAARMLGLNYIK